MTLEKTGCRVSSGNLESRRRRRVRMSAVESSVTQHLLLSLREQQQRLTMGQHNYG